MSDMRLKKLKFKKPNANEKKGTLLTKRTVLHILMDPSKVVRYAYAKHVHPRYDKHIEIIFIYLF